MHAQHFFIERDVWERSIYDNFRFDIRDFRATKRITKAVYIRVTHLHIVVPTITRSLFTLETDYPSGLVIRQIIRVRQIIRLNVKMERSSFWMENPPGFIHLFFRQF